MYMNKIKNPNLLLAWIRTDLVFYKKGWDMKGVCMCEAVEKYAETKRIDALYESVKNLMETMKLNAEQAMSAIKISENDKEVLLKRL